MGDQIWWADVEGSCWLAVPSASSSTTAALAVTSASAAYQFEMLSLAAKRTYRLCYGFDNYANILDLRSVQIVPLGQALGLAAHTVSAATNQSVALTAHAQDFLPSDRLWFQRGACSAAPPCTSP